jgi:hypothetical protein
MDISTEFQFKFTCREQIEAFCKILEKKERLEDLRQVIEAEYCGKKAPRLSDSIIYEIDDNAFGGEAECFNEFDAKNLVPDVLQEISELLPKNNFEAEVSICPDIDYLRIEGKYSYKNGEFFKECKEVDYRARRGDFILDGFFSDDKTIAGYEGSECVVTIPDDITTISCDAFANNDYIEEFISGNGLNIIEGEVFWQCSKLRKVVLSGNVEIVADGAFYECISLNEVIIFNDNIDLGEDVFKNDENVVIYAHEGSIAQKYAEEYGLEFKVLR